jgi:hypothetical protein
MYINTDNIITWQKSNFSNRMCNSIQYNRAKYLGWHLYSVDIIKISSVWIFHEMYSNTKLFILLMFQMCLCFFFSAAWFIYLKMLINSLEKARERYWIISLIVKVMRRILDNVDQANGVFKRHTSTAILMTWASVVNVRNTCIWKKYCTFK